MVYCMSALFIAIPKIYCVVARVSKTDSIRNLPLVTEATCDRALQWQKALMQLGCFVTAVLTFFSPMKLHALHSHEVCDA